MNATAYVRSTSYVMATPTVQYSTVSSCIRTSPCGDEFDGVNGMEYVTQTGFMQDASDINLDSAMLDRPELQTAKICIE